MFNIRRILCPTDFSAPSRVALPIAASLARDHGAILVLLHVRPLLMPVVGEFGVVNPEPPEPVEAVKARLRQFVPPNFKGTVEFHVADGDAAEEIVDVAKKDRCDMIVLGTHGRTGLSRFLIGSVAEEVLRKAPYPVMTIKQRPVELKTASSADEELNELVPVCTAANAVDAEIIRNALNAEGIGCFNDGVNQAGLVGTLGIPVTINVRAGDFDRANKFIQQRNL